MITAAAAVVGYVALILAISAGIDLRERNIFHDAPARYAAFVSALDRGSVDDIRAVDEWFDDHVPSGSESRASISLGASAAEDGEFDTARKFAGDLATEIELDQRVLDEKFAAAWSRAVPWLVIGSLLTAAALVLRHRRRSANADVVELVTRFVLPRPIWRRPVFLVVSGVGYTLLVTGFIAVVAATRVNELPWAARGFFIAGGVVALPIAYFVLRYSRPRSARGAVQALRADWRKPVLYLRGFGDDPNAAVVDRLPGALITGMITVHSREEQLIGALGAFGPVVAVGRPGEQLPHLGAARFYLPGDDWQPGVLRLMELSQLIVLRLGEGEGLWWEVDQACATQPPGKLVLLIPGDRPDLAERLDAHLPKPARLDRAFTQPGRWTSAVIAFGQDWTPCVEPVGPFPRREDRAKGTFVRPGRTNVPFAPATPVFFVAEAMQAALRSVGARRRAMGVRTNSHLLAAYGKVLLLVPGLFLVAYFLRFVFLW